MKANQVNIRSLLHYPKYFSGIVHESEDYILSRNSRIERNWLKYNLLLGSVISSIIDAFIREVNRGHIFYDDLFRTFLKEYSGADIPADLDSNAVVKSIFDNKPYFSDMDWDTLSKHCSDVMVYLLFYDFCKRFMIHLYRPIEQLYYISSQTDSRSIDFLFESFNERTIILNAIDRNADEIIKKLDDCGRVSYLHIKNNLDEVLARTNERETNRLPKELPYRFDDISNDRLITDIIAEVDIIHNLRITVVGERSFI